MIRWAVPRVKGLPAAWRRSKGRVCGDVDPKSYVQERAHRWRGVDSTRCSRGGGLKRAGGGRNAWERVGLASSAAAKRYWGRRANASRVGGKEAAHVTSQGLRGTWGLEANDPR